MEKRKKLLLILTTALSVVALIAAGAASLYLAWERAPQTEQSGPAMLTPAGSPAVETAPAQTPGAASTAPPTPTAPSTLSERKEGVYTILMVGNDDGHGNTDTIVVGKIDTAAHSMDFVNIPRDTLVNIDWSVRKINAVYWGDRNSGGNGIDRLKDEVEKLIGFQVDCYAVIDLGLFEEAVDTLGGVYFDVPMAMDYEDPTQDLSIHIQPGYQLLNGDQALGVCRFRSGYVTGDIGRIDMQQQFLKACMSQFITLGNVPNLTKVAKLLAGGMDTDLTAANIAFLLRQALQCDSEDIRFHTMPTTGDTVGGLSYTVIDLEKWLTMVNEALNPYYRQIGVKNVDIVYRRDGVYAGTAGLRGAWYYGGL